MDAQALIGMAVVALDDADRLGSIDELVFQTDPLRLTGLQVTDPRGRFAVLLERVRSVGADAITVESREVADAGVLATGVDGRLSLADLKHLKVVDETGALMGEVQGLDVDPADGRVISMNTIKGGVLGVGGTKLNLPPEAIRGIGAEVVTVKADAPAAGPPEASDRLTGPADCACLPDDRRRCASCPTCRERPANSKTSGSRWRMVIAWRPGSSSRRTPRPGRCRPSSSTTRIASVT